MLSHLREKISIAIFPEAVERRNQLERIAGTDELTNLANRRAFELAQPKARREHLAFIIFDLNNFGRVNKREGHAAGDRLLKYYADVLANVAHNFKARVFRLGGDEFIILAPPVFAARVRDAVERRALCFEFEDFTVSISGEVGMSLREADEKIQARKAKRKAA